MGTSTFNNFIKSIQGHIGTMNSLVEDLNVQAIVLTKRVAGGGPAAPQAATQLVRTKRQLDETHSAIRELKKFFVKMKTGWVKPQDRVIGHVVWAPSISLSTSPHGYTKDVCVIKLDKEKFLQNFRGNVLDLGAC